MHSGKALHGIIPALITPFKQDGTIDFVLIEKQTAYLADAGVDGFFVNGTTGEGPYLTTQEKIDVFQVVQQVSAGRQFLCLACLQESTQAVLDELRAFEGLTPDFVVSVAPYYYAAPQEVIIQHYEQIAQAAPVPLILYDIPSRTYNPIALETVFRLMPVENIVGLKDSSGDFIKFSRGVLAGKDPRFAWIQGEDYLDGPSLLVGANGFVTGLGNVCIEAHIAMRQAMQQGDRVGVLQAQQRINALYEVINVTGGKTIPAIKAGAALLGRSTPWMKMPGLTLTEQEIASVREVLVKLGLL